MERMWEKIYKEIKANNKMDKRGRSDSARIPASVWVLILAVMCLFAGYFIDLTPLIIAGWVLFGLFIILAARDL